MQIWVGIDRTATPEGHGWRQPWTDVRRAVRAFRALQPFGPPEGWPIPRRLRRGGCTVFNIAPVTDDSAEGVAAIGEVKRLLFSRY